MWKKLFFCIKFDEIITDDNQLDQSLMNLNNNQDSNNLRQDLLSMNDRFIQSMEDAPEINIKIKEFHLVLFKKILMSDTIFLPMTQNYVAKNHQQMKKAYVLIKKDIETQPTNLFNTIISCYLKFLQSVPEVLNKQQNLQNPTDHKLCQENSQDIGKPSDIAKPTLQQLDFILQLLRYYVEKIYESVLMFHLSHEGTYKLEKDICVDRIIQHFIFPPNSPSITMLSVQKMQYCNSLNDKYLDEQINMNQTTLDKIYHPKRVVDPKEVPLVSDSYNDISSFPRQELGSKCFYMNNNEEESQPQSTFQVLLLRIIEKAQEDKNSQDHYNQITPMLVELILTKKFWKIFYLIGKLDQFIEKLFMHERSHSKINKYQNIISAGETKCDILIFVLYSFQRANSDIRFKNDLYESLRLMQDFDGFLHYDLKNVHTPHFLRFFGILEMLIQQELAV